MVQILTVRPVGPEGPLSPLIPSFPGNNTYHRPVNVYLRFKIAG
jgi:hypothetical protein